MARALLTALALLPCVRTVRTDDTVESDEELNVLEAQGQQTPDDGIPRLCQAALPDETNFWRFMIGYEASKGLDHNQKFTLRPNDDCSGKDLGNVSVIPRIHPEDPLRRSKVVITLQPKEYGRRVFVCRAGRGRAPCVASAQPRARGFRPNQLLLWVPGLAESARVQSLVLLVGSAHRVVDLLEWALLSIILCFLATTLHALYILRFRMRLEDIWGGWRSTATRVSTSRTSAVSSSQAAEGRVLEVTEVKAATAQEAAEDRVAQAEALEHEAARREVAEDEATDPSAPELKMEQGETAKVETAEGKAVEEAEPPRLCPVDISSPFWESLDALVNSISFVVACVSLLSVVLTILVTAHGHPFLLFIAISWPCVCGNFMLYCFWMTTCRLQIYSAALSRGICVRGKSTSSSMLVMAACIFLLLFCVLATGYTLWEAQQDANYDKVKKITPFVINPMSTLLSICVYIYFRILAHSRTQCPTAIDQMVELMGKSEGSGQQAAEPDGPSADGGRLARLVRLGAVPIVSEGAFCQLCRSGGDPVAAIGAAAAAEEPLAEGRSFSILDLAWHGKMVHTLSGYSVAILNIPVALFFFLVFAGASVWFAIICLTTRPGLSSIYTSENSLGHLAPDFRSWQTDYEFLLDSTAHSATLVGALAQDSTNKVSVTLPDGRHLQTYDDLVMATVELDGVTFPTSVGIVAEGIRRQSTRYHLAVVKEYLLIVAVRIVGKDFDRFMRWGEVVGGVITVPGMIDLQVEIYYRSYNMGVPVNEPDASAMSQGKDLMTVFVPMENKYNKCWIHCANTDHCLASEIGVTGCFFVYGFGNASLFNRKNLTESWSASKATLGVSLCSRQLMGSLECGEMDHITPNILSVKMPKLKPISEVQKYEFYPYKIFEGRKVMEEKRRIAFSMAAPKPIAVLAMIGRFIHTTVDLGGGDIQVILHKYYPTSDWEVLRLHLAVLVPDKLCSITIPSYVDAKLEYSPPDFSVQCRREAAKNKYIEQYTVCGGWRPSTVVVADVRPWQPWQDITLNLALLGKSKSVKIHVRTAGDAQPAEWVVQKHCALDLQSLSPAESSEVVSEQVIHTMTRTCLQMTIQLRCRVWRPDIVEWSQDFLFRHFDANTAIKLFAQADQNPGIKNFTGFYKDVGLTRDGDHLLLSIHTKAERKIMPLNLGYVVQNPRSTGRFAQAACRMARLEDVQVSILSAAVDRADLSIVRSVVRCIEKRRGHLEPTSSGQHAHPEIGAIQLKRQDLLKEVLKVWPSCISWQDGDQDNMERSFTLLELSVAYGCAFCVNVLRSAGLDATRLVFTSSTKPLSWKKSAGRVLNFMAPKRITFSHTSTTLSRILTKLLPIAKAGDMEYIEYLSFFYTSQTHYDAEDDPGLADRLCQLVKATPKLKVLFLGFSMGSIQKAREILACLHVVPHLEELDLDHHLLFELGRWSEERTRFYMEFILKFPRLRVLHYSALAASRIPASNATLSMLKRRLPRLSIRPDLDVEAVAAFQRFPCRPRLGMKAHVLNTAPKIATLTRHLNNSDTQDGPPELGVESGAAEDSLPELGGAGDAAEERPPRNEGTRGRSCLESASMVREWQPD